jgi:hypothetical protein
MITLFASHSLILRCSTYSTVNECTVQEYIQDEMLALKIVFVLSPFTEKTRMVQKPASHALFPLQSLRPERNGIQYNYVFFLCS